LKGLKAQSYVADEFYNKKFATTIN
jgi:hypothetical protein